MTISACSSTAAPKSRVDTDSTLVTALDGLPELADGTVMFTDWAAYGHQRSDVFAAKLVDIDDQVQRDLGFHPTDAEWELEVWQPGKASTAVLQFADLDLSGLPGRLARFGYHADGSVYTGKIDESRLWTIGARFIGTDPGRHRLVVGTDEKLVRSMLTATPHPLSRAEALTPLLAAAQSRRVVTAAITVGSATCVQLADVISKGRATPEMIQAVRAKFPGTFTTPQAQLTAVTTPTGTAGFDALAFTDEHTAKANRDGRSAAMNTFSSMGGVPGIQITDSAVDGRVLSFELATQDPKAIRDRVMTRTLGLDLCP